MSLKVERISSEQEDERSEIAPYRIVAYPADYTLQGLHDKWKARQIVIPPIQRHYVWTHVQASRLIESFLLGLPVPGIFFYRAKGTEDLLVIDGLQRLKSVFAFFDGKLPESSKSFALKGVQTKWEGKIFTELAQAEQARLKDTVLRAVIIDQLDPKDDSSIFHIFERLNTGGTSLRPQEVRNCIYSGPFNEMLLKLNREPTWRRIMGTKQSDKRMRDVELILRVLALFEHEKEYSKPMKEFLSAFMKKNQSAGRDRLEELANHFRKTCSAVVKSLGPKPFHVRAGLNAAVFDSVMVAFAGHRGTFHSNLKSRFQKLMRTPKYVGCVSSKTTDVDVVKKRIVLARKALFGNR